MLKYYWNTSERVTEVAGATMEEHSHAVVTQF